jgi:hypothetical protein
MSVRGVIFLGVGSVFAVFMAVTISGVADPRLRSPVTARHA